MAAKELLENKPDASRAEVREWMSGNYCRCTGYHAIVEAICETLALRAGSAGSAGSAGASDVAVKEAGQ
jgi:carbon-monoxide dehydrogenase small subunit